MVLQDLSRKLQQSISKLTTITAPELAQFTTELQTALLSADIHHSLVQKVISSLQSHIKSLSNPSKQDILRHLLATLTTLFTPALPPALPTKGVPHVILLVGLQGHGKTTTCTKIARFYSKRGLRVGLVCTDTFRAGAFDQLKQNARKIAVAFYGSYAESDPVVLAEEGVKRFKKERFDVIIVDTSGRHSQDSELFNEMKEIEKAVNPDNVMFVIDGSIGQTAEIHVKAFQECVKVGSIVITKMDGHSKGGGAVTAVARMKVGIVFVGTGEGVDDLELFKADRFVSKMLGMGDMTSLMESIQEANIDKEGLIRNITKGVFTFRDMKGQFAMISGMGPLSKIMGMIPGMPQELASDTMDNEGSSKLKKFGVVMDSMTKQELDSDSTLFQKEPSRMTRIVRGSGVGRIEVEELMKQFEMMAGMVKGIGGPNGLLSNMMGGQKGPDLGEMMKGFNMADMMKNFNMADMMKNLKQ